MNASGVASKPRPTPKQIQCLEWMAVGTRFREAEAELGLADRALKGRIQKLRRLTGKNRSTALVYWGLTEMYIHLRARGLPKLAQHYLDVVELLAQDKTNRQIAQALNITVYTVESRIRKAREKVGARTEAQLVAICWAEDWIA